MSSALKSVVVMVVGIFLTFTVVVADVEVNAVQGEKSYSGSPKVDVEKNTMRFGDKVYKWTDLIEVKLRSQQREPKKDYKIYLRNGNVIYGEILGAEVEGTDLFLKIKSSFLGGETRTVSTDGIAGMQNLAPRVYLRLALASLQRKAKAAPFGRIEFHGTMMTAEELQALFEKEADKFVAEAEKALAETSADFARYMKHKKRWEFDFFYGVKSGETEAYGLIDSIDDNLAVVLVREKSKKKVSGNLKDIVGLGFKAVNLPKGFGVDPYVKIFGVRGEIATGQIVSGKDDVIEVRTDLDGITLKMSVDEIAEMIFFNGSFVFLSDPPNTTVETREYGDICLPGTTTSDSFPWQRDRSTLQKRPPLKLNGKIYRKGIGAHSHSELTFDIGGNFKRFKAFVGIDNDVPKPGNVTVEVYGDEKVLLKKTTVKTGDKPLPVDVDITGVAKLRIVVDFGEGGYHNDHCDIANAILVK